MWKKEKRCGREAASTSCGYITKGTSGNESCFDQQGSIVLPAY